MANGSRWLGAVVCVVSLPLLAIGMLVEAPIREALPVMFTVASFALVGAFVVFKRPGNAVGVWFLTITFFSGLTAFTNGYGAALGADIGFDALPVKTLAWIGNWVWWVVIASIPTFPLLLFPNGKPPSRRWRWALYLSAASIATGFLGFGFAGGPVEIGGDGPVVPPLFSIGFLQAPAEVLQIVAFPLGLASALASVLSLIVRFRRARGDERQQIKWVAYAGSLMGVFFIIGFFVPAIGDNDFFFAGAITPLPIAAAVAILRYRLYDIDVIVNRTLVYGALSAVLAGTYFAFVVGFQTLLDPMTQQSDVAVAASTLAVAALFGPLRRRIQGFIDRRFYRSRYDAQATLESFSARLRDEVELGRVNEQLLAAVSQTMRPQHASLWLRSGEAR